ncbi:MAG TPA: serine/threonine-protein kinase [Solirubrobacterales bacterium]|nr:serine/threonine-protein kinase [Solirubrobacterales bacterium]
MAVVEGERVLGRFTIGERIGGGGHGTVHRAWDERLCREVAVKAIAGESAGRVMREAHAAARLNHPGIVTLYELGGGPDCTYLVSELVEGPNLRELAAAGELSDRDLADLGAELCTALEHAHDSGVVHRDIKPDNVLVRPARSRSVKGRPAQRALLADFGIASLDDAPTLTATGQVVGTLAYMSPEQATGEGVGPASDVYSLGLTLYELWAGFNPVARLSPAATARAIGDPVEPLAEARPELPPALSGAVDACLDPDPAERPHLGALREVLIEVRGALHPDRAVPPPAEALGVATLPPGVPARPLAVLLAAGAVALLGMLAGLPGLALVLAVLLAPAALALHRVRDWALPAAAPVLGLVGAAPAFLAVAARRERLAERATLAGLAWAWTAVAGTLAGRPLGVPLGSADPAGWAGSGPTTMDALIAPMLTPTAIAIALTWIGGAILLGLLLDATSPAGAAVGGLIWAGAIVALLGAAGDGATAALLAPALLLSVAWAIWDRAGRPDLRPRRTAPPSGRTVTARHRGPERPTKSRRTAPRRPRNPAALPPADGRIRATRTATKHVRAALHGAGSHAGLP